MKQYEYTGRSLSICTGVGTGCANYVGPGCDGEQGVMKSDPYTFHFAHMGLIMVFDFLVGTAFILSIAPSTHVRGQYTRSDIPSNIT